ncbi:hypothetical protein QQ045_029836 [Rhodiola kirilowii]
MITYNPDPKPVCTIDPYNFLNLTRNPNGSITRTSLTGVPAITTDDDQLHQPILIKDVALDPTKNTWFRIYVPRSAPPDTKLPLVVFFHGGCFILFSATKLAGSLPAVVVSLDYHLAPEHKLPAAYGDAIDLVHKLKSSDDYWLASYADFSNCFLMGSSSGGNIAYHAGLRSVATAALNGDLQPLKIKGLVLLHAFFGGVERSASELRIYDQWSCGSNIRWELALPEGADRDHEYCNFNNGDKYEEEFEKIKKMGWRVLLVGGKVEAAEMFEKRGVDVETEFGEGDVHYCIELFDESKARELFEKLIEKVHMQNWKELYLISNTYVGGLLDESKMMCLTIQ